MNIKIGYVMEPLSKISSEPLTLSCDFELGIINSIEEVFPNCQVCGCFFHLKKSIYRKIQSTGLVEEYGDVTNNENQTRLYCKMLACLAFVPVDFVVDAFEEIKKKAPSKVIELYKYFEEYYIGKISRGRYATRKTPIYEISMWNCVERTKLGLPRTNNNLEGWHNGIKSTIRSHPHLLSLIDCLKLEQSNTENSI
ncbi:unnamed protein product [Brachionus calyciflorus]|uniref:MULE transposase domain-containing protein n=2 Tax=Brachionus calyciflorus TaxID=104777 RepID=A0A814JLS3_9BILA|nr:unnamed protein product [Brachionus calyciflorus]